MGSVPVERGRGFRAPFRVGFALLLIRARLRHLRLSPLSFFSPNCLRWVRRCARPMVGSRWYGTDERGAGIRRRKLESRNSETQEFELEGRSRFQISHFERFEKARPGVGGPLYPRI